MVKKLSRFIPMKLTAVLKFILKDYEKRITGLDEAIPEAIEKAKK